MAQRRARGLGASPGRPGLASVVVWGLASLLALALLVNSMVDLFQVHSVGCQRGGATGCRFARGYHFVEVWAVVALSTVALTVAVLGTVATLRHRRATPDLRGL